MVATAPKVAAASVQVVSGGGAGAYKSSAAVLQVVSTSTAGTIRSSLGNVQVVTGGAGGATVNATFGNVQVVTNSTSAYIRSTSASLQLVRSGLGSQRYKAGSATIQPVYTLGIQDVPRRLAWTYTLDGHYFYCLDLGEDGTHVYDLTTKQWTKFDTAGYSGHFNFKNGILWKTGKRIVGGDVLTGAVYEMLPESYLDDGWRPAYYEARGALFATGISKRKNYALRMVGSTGRLADAIAPVLHMRFSDDQGASWSNEYSITLTTDSKQRLEWRSLGAFAAPGRIFRLYDTGGVKYIGWVEADIQ